jgi:hypothetical protein
LHGFERGSSPTVGFDADVASFGCLSSPNSCCSEIDPPSLCVSICASPPEKCSIQLKLRGRQSCALFLTKMTCRMLDARRREPSRLPGLSIFSPIICGLHSLLKSHGAILACSQYSEQKQQIAPVKKFMMEVFIGFLVSVTTSAYRRGRGPS